MSGLFLQSEDSLRNKNQPNSLLLYSSRLVYSPHFLVYCEYIGEWLHLIILKALKPDEPCSHLCYPWSLPMLYNPWIIKILSNSYFHIASCLPWLYLHISSSESFLLCPLGTPISGQTVLYPLPLYQMFLLTPSLNLYSPLLFLNHYFFLLLTTVLLRHMLSHCICHSLTSHLMSTFQLGLSVTWQDQEEENGHKADKLMRRSMEYYLVGRIRPEIGKVDWGGRQNVWTTLNPFIIDKVCGMLELAHASSQRAAC